MYLSNDVQYYILEGAAAERLEQLQRDKNALTEERFLYFAETIGGFDPDTHRCVMVGGFSSVRCEGVEDIDGAVLPDGWGRKKLRGFGRIIAPKGSSKAAKDARKKLNSFTTNDTAAICKTLGIKYDILSGVGCEKIGPHWIVSLGKDRKWNHEGKARLAKLSEVAALAEEYGEEEE